MKVASNSPYSRFTLVDRITYPTQNHDEARSIARWTDKNHDTDGLHGRLRQLVGTEKGGNGIDPDTLVQGRVAARRCGRTR